MAGAGARGRVPPRTRGLVRARAEASAISRRITLRMQDYIHAEEAAGFMLMAATAAALLWANSPWSAAYRALIETKLSLDLGVVHHAASVRHWVNDGLMVFFFLLIGLEIKREVLLGHLQGRRRAALPVAAALGGMAVPALAYLAVNPSGEAARGWGIPVATDIAFALGVLALLGRRVPVELRVFLLAFATVDDIGGILIIAVFYAHDLSGGALAVAAVTVLVLLLLRRFSARHAAAYVLLGLLLWLAVLKSGIHPTIAGVVLGLLVPARRTFDHQRLLDEIAAQRDHLREALDREDQHEIELRLGGLEEFVRESERPVERLDRLLRPWVSFLVLPLFALANAGLELSLDVLDRTARSPVAWGIALGLLAGKLVGVSAATWLAVRSGLAELPPRVTWRHVLGAGILAGIGFTVSLFIADLAFDDGEHAREAQLAILTVSLIAAFAGIAFFAWTARGRTQPV